MVFFFKQKTAYDMRISDWSSDVCSSDLVNQSTRLFQQAADAVKDDKVLSHRVRRERLSLDIATLYRYNLLKQTAAREGKKFLGPEDPNAAMRSEERRVGKECVSTCRSRW